MMSKKNGKQMQPDERMERLNKMLAGKVEPPNEMVGYFVEQMRKIGSEADNVRKSLQQYRDMASQLESRAHELQGMQKKCVEDIQHWDKDDTKLEDEEPQLEGEDERPQPTPVPRPLDRSAESTT